MEDIRIDVNGKEITWGSDTVMEKLTHEGKSAIVFHSKDKSRHNYVNFATDKIRDDEASRVEKILTDKGVKKIW